MSNLLGSKQEDGRQNDLTGCILVVGYDRLVCYIFFPCPEVIGLTYVAAISQALCFLYIRFNRNVNRRSIESTCSRSRKMVESLGFRAFEMLGSHISRTGRHSQLCSFHSAGVHCDEATLDALEQGCIFRTLRHGCRAIAGVGTFALRESVQKGGISPHPLDCDFVTPGTGPPFQIRWFIRIMCSDI
jgi:hypothetical protein